jgi:catechol 2,3-dioxygenase-like lactoylglutathione lyase family enzyme
MAKEEESSFRTPISHVRYVALAVEDFATERNFLQHQWCLSEVFQDGETAYFAAYGSTEPFIIRLRQSADRRTDLYAFAAEDRTGVDLLFARITDKGGKIVSQPHELSSPGGGYGFRCFDIDGRLVEISADVQHKVAEARQAKAALPEGLSHVVFHSPNIKQTVAWYEDVLGLRVSDWLDEFMCFMRGNGRKHHCMAFLVGPPALNHIAFELANADEMMRGLGRMLKNEIALNWGPGRHTAGDNTFAYFVSPAGNILEYTAELEYLPEDWKPRTMPRTPEVIDQWGTGRITGKATYPPIAPDPALWVADLV